MIPLRLNEGMIHQWRAHGYTHLHYGAIRLALTFHGRKGLPVVARVALLDIRYREYQHACIETIQTTLNAEIMAYRVQNHAMDLSLPRDTEDALLIQLESQHSPSCIHIPRQIPREELVKRKDGAVEIVFKQQEEKSRPTAFCTEINTISPTDNNYDEKLYKQLHGVPIKSFDSLGDPVYSFADDTCHKFFDVCDCEKCLMNGSDEEDTPRRKKKSSQQILKERYESGDPQVGLFGEPNGRNFEYYVLYPSNSTPATPDIQEVRLSYMFGPPSDQASSFPSQDFEENNIKHLWKIRNPNTKNPDGSMKRISSLHQELLNLATTVMVEHANPISAFLEKVAKQETSSERKVKPRRSEKIKEEAEEEVLIPQFMMAEPTVEENDSDDGNIYEERREHKSERNPRFDAEPHHGATLLTVIDKLVSKFQGRLRQWWISLGEYRQLQIRQTPSIDALVGHIRNEFLGAWNHYTDQAREEYLSMKCCSFKRKDLEKHYERMSKRFYALNGIDDVNLKKKSQRGFKKSDRCYICKKKGHYAKQCPNKKKRDNLLGYLAQIEDIDDSDIESIFSFDDEASDNTILAMGMERDEDSSDESSTEEEEDADDQFMLFDLYTFDACKVEEPKKEELAYISQPLPNVKIYIFPTKYDKPIPVIAYLDTGAASPIIKPDILPASHWNPSSVAFKAANGQIFHFSLISKPIYIQIFPGYMIKSKVYGSELPGKYFILGFDVLHGLKRVSWHPNISVDCFLFVTGSPSESNDSIGTLYRDLIKEVGYMQQEAEEVHSANKNVLVILSGLTFDTDPSFIRSRPVNISFTGKLVFELQLYSFSDKNSWEVNNPNDNCGQILNRIEKCGGFLLNQGFPLFLSEFGIDERGRNANDDCLQIRSATSEIRVAVPRNQVRSENIADLVNYPYQVRNPGPTVAPSPSTPISSYPSKILCYADLQINGTDSKIILWNIRFRRRSSPSREHNPENVPEGWCCAYVNFFEKCGLFFPIPTCVLETLRHLRLAFPQMTPNFVRHILALFTRAHKEVRARDTSETTQDVFALAALLRRERNTWATFSRDRIRSVLGAAPANQTIPILAVPAIQQVPVPQDPLQDPTLQDPVPQVSPPQVQESPVQVPGALPLRLLSRVDPQFVPTANEEISLRAQQAAAGGSDDRARTGDLAALVAGARNALAAPHASTSSAQASGSDELSVNADVPPSPKRARVVPGASSLEVPPDVIPLVLDQQKVIQDESGVAHLLHHIKGHSWLIPAVKNLTEIEAFIMMMVKNEQALAAQNKVVALYEQRLSKVPSASELEEARKLVTEEEISKLKAELSSSKDSEKNLTRDIAKLGEEIGAVKADKHSSTNQIHCLEDKNADLSQKVMNLTISRVQEVKAAVREAKAGLVSVYAKVLSSIKEKWIAKKDHSLHEGHAVE
ncbi:unnamed protein product, partial [Arabidopsis halleri]